MMARDLFPGGGIIIAQGIIGIGAFGVIYNIEPEQGLRRCLYPAFLLKFD